MLITEKCENRDEVVLKGREDLVNYLHDCKNKNVPVLLCLSGGSALDLLNNFEFSSLGDNVTVTVLDERFSSDPEVNNMAQIEMRGFLDKAKDTGCSIIDTKVRNEETIEEFSTGFNMALARWIENHKQGKIVATVGMGPDGHTAGIIPGSSNFKELFMQHSGRLVVGYKAANQPMDRVERVSTTFEFLRLVAFAVLIVMGEEKRPALARLMAGQGDLEETPARIWREIPGVAKIYTDLQN